MRRKELVDRQSVAGFTAGTGGSGAGEHPHPAIWLAGLLVAFLIALLVALFPDARRCRVCRTLRDRTAFPNPRQTPRDFPEDVCWNCIEDAISRTGNMESH